MIEIFLCRSGASEIWSSNCLGFYIVVQFCMKYTPDAGYICVSPVCAIVLKQLWNDMSIKRLSEWAIK